MKVFYDQWFVNCCFCVFRVVTRVQKLFLLMFSLFILRYEDIYDLVANEKCYRQFQKHIATVHAIEIVKQFQLMLHTNNLLPYNRIKFSFFGCNHIIPEEKFNCQSHFYTL